MTKFFCINSGGNKYNVYVNYKRIRKIYFRIKNYDIYVSCPIFTTQAYIEKALLELLSKQKYSNKPYNDEYVYILGEKKYFDDGFVRAFNHYVLFGNIDNFYENIKPYFLEYMTSLVREQEIIMGIDKPYKVRVKRAKTFFGCNYSKTHAITFDIILLHFSEDIIKSIVIHELCHDKIKNHKQEFYDLVLKYCPNYKTLHKKLVGNIYS